jgi:hypothetical protein
MLQGWLELLPKLLHANGALVESREVSQIARRAQLGIGFQALLGEPCIPLELLPVLGILGTKATATSEALIQHKRMRCGLTVARMRHSTEEAQ